MWTGTPYDRWQKRLGVTLFFFAIAAFTLAGIFEGHVSRETGSLVVYCVLAIAIALFSAMAILLFLKKLYFAWAKRNGHAFDNVDY